MIWIIAGIAGILVAVLMHRALSAKVIANDVSVPVGGSTDEGPTGPVIEERTDLIVEGVVEIPTIDVQTPIVVPDPIPVVLTPESVVAPVKRKPKITSAKPKKTTVSAKKTTKKQAKTPKKK